MKDLQGADVPGNGSHYPATALTIIDPRWTLFVRVVAAGSLSKAAVLLDMPQSMVSRNIALLESQCGERLFHRTGRGVVLTEFGEHLLPCISDLLADAEGLADDIRNLRGKPVGEVVVGMLPSAVRRFAGTLFAAVRAQMPGVRLHLIEGASAQLEEQLHDGRLGYGAGAARERGKHRTSPPAGQATAASGGSRR